MQTKQQIDPRECKLNDVLAVVEWLRNHPEVALPALDTLSIFAWDTKEEAAAMAKAMGTCEKSYDESFFRLTKSFGSIQLQGVFSRNQVCERVVVGTKEIETEEADPVAVAQLPTVKVKKQVDIVEWRCPDSLLGVQPTGPAADPDWLNPAEGGNEP